MTEALVPVRYPLTEQSRERRMVRRIVDDPDIAGFLEGELDTEIVTV